MTVAADGVVALHSHCLPRAISKGSAGKVAVGISFVACTAAATISVGTEVACTLRASGTFPLVAAVALTVAFHARDGRGVVLTVLNDVTTSGAIRIPNVT